MTSTGITEHLTVGAFSATELASRFGTPLFVYDATVIRSAYAEIMRCLTYRPLSVYYSVKANSAPGILAVLRAAGARADICSPGDLAFAEAAGFSASELSFTGSGLTAAEIAIIASRPGLQFVADSLAQIEIFLRCGPVRPFGVRINPEIDAGFHPSVQAGARDSRFGLRASEVPKALELARQGGASISGLHGHLGSDVFNAEPFQRLASTLIELSRDIPTISWLNLGGGFGVRRGGAEEVMELDRLATGLGALMKGANRGRSSPVELRVEPGGFLTMSSGLLLTRVTDIKDRPSDDGVTTALVDASTNQLPSAVLYNTYHPVRAAEVRVDRPRRCYHVAGNLMLAGDLLAKDRELPEIKIGDLLAFGRCGAYSSTRSAVFNNRGRPAEVLVDTDSCRLIRARETDEDLLRLFAIGDELAG